MIIKSYNLINILYALWPKVMCLLSLDFLSPVIPFFKGKPYSLSAILNCNVYCCVLPILWFIETKLGRHNWHHAQRVPEQFGDSATLWSKKLKASASYLSDKLHYDVFVVPPNSFISLLHLTRETMHI